MGMFFTRVDNKEVSHKHNEKYTTTVKHVRASTEDAQKELQDFKKQARLVLNEELEIKNTELKYNNIKVELLFEERCRDTLLFIGLILHDKKVLFKETIDRELLWEKNKYRLEDKMKKFLVKHLPKYLTGEVT